MPLKVDTLFDLSCMIMVNALQRMKKLLELIHTLRSATEIWPMLGRYLLSVFDFRCFSFYSPLLVVYALIMLYAAGERQY